MSGYEMASFTHRVDYDHRSVHSMCIGEFDNEVDANDIPSSFGYWKWVQFSEQFAFLCLCLKTHIASLAVPSNVARHVQPPVAPRNKFESLPMPCMSPNFGVMVLFSNSAS